MKQGFTLIEMLLYIASATVVLLLASQLLHVVLESRVRQEVMATVEEEGRFALNAMVQELRSSTNVVAPAPTASASTLTLDFPGGTQDVISLSGSALQIQKGASTAEPITSSHIVASALTFTNNSAQATGDSVQISFTLTHVNPDNRPEYIYAKTFTTTVTIRP